MNIVVVGLSHKTAPVEVREKLTFPTEKIGEALYNLKSYPGIDESAILSTCNRVEICAVVKNTVDGFKGINEFLISREPSLDHSGLVPHLYFYSSKDAIRHIFRVASSVDSLVVGEPQILGQFKDAFESAQMHKSIGIVLNKILKKAIFVAKRVRTETRISESAVSVSYAAVELAKKIFGSLEGKVIMLVGAGEMAELAARHLIGSGVKDVIITTRNFEKAVELAAEFKGRPIKFDEHTKGMAEADIIICSTGAPTYIIRADDVKEAIHKRKNRPIFLIDISVPRNIEPKVNDIDNVYLYNIDDLQTVVAANIKEREREAGQAEDIISEEVETTSRWLKSLEVVPTIVALKSKAEEIRRSELEKTLSRLGRLSETERQAVEVLTSSIINKLLHAPLVSLKHEASSENGSTYIEAARRLFNLDKDIPRHNHKKWGEEDTLKEDEGRIIKDGEKA